MASTAAQAQHVQRRQDARAGAHRRQALAHHARRADARRSSASTWCAHAWWGILAPAGTPKPIIDKMVAELKKAIKLPDVNKMLTETQGMDVVALGPDATQKWIVDNMARWGKVVKDNNIRSRNEGRGPRRLPARRAGVRRLEVAEGRRGRRFSTSPFLRRRRGKAAEAVRRRLPDARAHGVRPRADREAAQPQVRQPHRRALAEPRHAGAEGARHPGEQHALRRRRRSPPSS